jgi:head-tail adaptor
MNEIAGLLSERVALERRVRVGDGAGGFVESWVAVDTLWAGLAVVRPGPDVEAERLRRASRYRVTVRDRADLTFDVRLRWRGVVLGVLGVTRDPGVPGFAELLVEARASTGSA